MYAMLLFLGGVCQCCRGFGRVWIWSSCCDTGWSRLHLWHHSFVALRRHCRQPQTYPQ